MRVALLLRAVKGKLPALIASLTLHYPVRPLRHHAPIDCLLRSPSVVGRLLRLHRPRFDAPHRSATVCDRRSAVVVRSGSGAHDDFPDHGAKTAFGLPIRTRCCTVVSGRRTNFPNLYYWRRPIPSVPTPNVVSRPPGGVKRRPLHGYGYAPRASVTCAENVRSVGRPFKRCFGAMAREVSA